MTQHIEETTFRDMATAMFPKYQHTKLARSAAEFFMNELSPNLPESMPTTQPPRFDAATVRAFVEFLITKKGYN